MLLLSDVYLQLNFDPASFLVSAMMHPSTYLNKVLLGSHQGALQLWNLKTRSDWVILYLKSFFNSLFMCDYLYFIIRLLLDKQTCRWLKDLP